MNKLFLLVFLFLTSCAHFNYELISPTPVDVMTAEDDSSKVSFWIPVSEPRFINFTFTNKLDIPVKIMWDDASMSLNGYTYKIIHKGSIINSANFLSQPTNIAGKQFLKERISPSEKAIIKCGRRNENCKYELLPFLPHTYGRALQFDNSKIVILIPIQISGNTFNKVYEISAKLIRK